MVQLQVACYKKELRDLTNSGNGQQKEECDIISELLFDNGANNGSTTLPNVNPPLSPQDIDGDVKIMASLTDSLVTNNGCNNQEREDKEVPCCGEKAVIKSNIVMFEYREQTPNFVGEEVGPFASFFDNDCDLFEHVRKYMKQF